MAQRHKVSCVVGKAEGHVVKGCTVNRGSVQKEDVEVAEAMLSSDVETCHGAEMKKAIVPLTPTHEMAINEYIVHELEVMKYVCAYVGKSKVAVGKMDDVVDVMRGERNMDGGKEEVQLRVRMSCLE
jgi:hypothetical protein